MIGIKTFNKYLTVSIILIFMLVNIYGDLFVLQIDFKNNDYRQVVNSLEANSRGDEEIFVYPHYYGWIINYYKKQDELTIPKTSDVKYGWWELQDSIATHKPEKFWMVFDYGSEDTATYKDKLNWLNNDYNIYFLIILKYDLFGTSKQKKLSEVKILYMF